MDKSSPRESIGGHIRRARERCGLSPKDVSRLVEKDVMTVYRWEWGKREPSFADLERMADAFGVTVGQLVDGSEPDGIGGAA